MVPRMKDRHLQVSKVGHSLLALMLKWVKKAAVWRIVFSISILFT